MIISEKQYYLTLGNPHGPYHKTDVFQTVFRQAKVRLVLQTLDSILFPY